MRACAYCRLVRLTLGALLVMCAAQPLSARAATDGAPLVSLAPPSSTGDIEATLSPGHRLSTAIVVTDGGAVPADFLVSPVDGYTSDAGGILYGDRQAPFRSGQSGNAEYGAGRWISVSASVLHLKPGQSQRLTVAVIVPTGTLPGDWVGGVSIQNAASTGTVTPTAPSNGTGTQPSTPGTSVMAVIIHVPGAISRGALIVGLPVITTQSSQQVLEIPLSYTGDVLTKPTYSFTITDSRGRTAFSTAGRFDTFVPHSAITDVVRVAPPLVTGAYNFDSVAGPDGNTLVAQYPILSGVPTAIPAPSVPAISAPAAVSSNGPQQLIAVVLVVTALGLVIWRRTRCSHCRRRGLGGLVTVSGYAEIAHCSDCRLLALQREDVHLCSNCHRGHLILGDDRDVDLAGRSSRAVVEQAEEPPLRMSVPLGAAESDDLATVSMDGARSSRS